MGDIADVYESTRRSIIDLLESRPAADLELPVPATPGWRVRDVVAHLIGDIDCVSQGDYPRGFFEAFGDDEGVESLNRWTADHLTDRSGRSLDDLVAEWDELAPAIVAMMRGEAPWPDDIPESVVDNILVIPRRASTGPLWGPSRSNATGSRLR